MSHLRLTYSMDAAADPADPANVRGAGGAGGEPSAAAARFAAFTPMNDQPALADRKATFVVAAGGLLLSSALFFVVPLGRFAAPGWRPAATLALALAVACLTLLAIATAYRCYVLPVPARPGNPLFFRNVAAVTADAYAGALASATRSDALGHALDYNHAMATLAVAKYRLAGRALAYLRLAIPAWVMLLVAVTVPA